MEILPRFQEESAETSFGNVKNKDWRYRQNSTCEDWRLKVSRKGENLVWRTVFKKSTLAVQTSIRFSPLTVISKIPVLHSLIIYGRKWLKTLWKWKLIVIIYYCQRSGWQLVTFGELPSLKICPAVLYKKYKYRTGSFWFLSKTMFEEPW